MRRTIYLLFAILTAGCGMMQKVIKSSFPYTANLVIPATARIDQTESAISIGSSFDQNFVKDGNNASRISRVRIVSAKLKATNPSSYNIGDIGSIKIYIAKADGSDEVLVASRTDIGNSTGNSISLDIDNSHFLDEHVRERNVRIRMIYKLRKQANVDVSLHVVLDLTADVANKN